MGQLKSLEHQESQLNKQRSLHQSQLASLSKQLIEAERRVKEASHQEEMKQIELCKLEETLEAEQLNHTNLRREMETMFTEVENI